jgi:hypothetical protein
MKPSHAAAFALVGWYLMMPPYKGIIWGCDPIAPMSQWSRLWSFNSESECKDRLDDLRKKPDTQRRGFGGNYYRFMNSVCILSSDPRLAK